MATEWMLPNLGESVKSGLLAKVLVEVGDTIEEDQPVLELETDKAVMEVPSTVSGTVREIHVKPGQKLDIGAKIFTVDAEGESASSDADASANASVQAASNGAATNSNGAAASNGATSNGATENATLLEGMGAAQQGAESVSASSNGSSNGAPSGNGSSTSGNGSSNGALQQEAVEKGTATQEPDAVSSKLPETRDGYTSNTAPAQEGANGSNGASSPAMSTHARAGTIPAAPSVRRLARELGVDIAQVQGSGPSGRLSFADVKNFLQKSVPAPSNGTSSGGGITPISLPDFAKWGEIERQPMSGIRRATADQMARSWNTVPHVTQFDRADITELELLRKQFGAKAEKAGGKLTVTAIALKVVASALKAFPQFNASIDMANNEIVLKKYVHIGVAVDTERGLVVPVIRDVDKKNIIQLTTELTQLGEKARAKKTSLDDMQGGGFTITNLGGIGGTGFTPIVNTPEVAILGMARGTQEPVWTGDKFEPRLMLPLSLSYDHRAIDGADGARFLRWIAQALEQPFLLALEG